MSTGVIKAQGIILAQEGVGANWATQVQGINYPKGSA